MKKRVLGFLLAFMMILNIAPISVLADTSFSVDVTPPSNGDKSWGYVSKINLSGEAGGIEDYFWEESGTANTYILNVVLKDETPDDTTITSKFTTAGMREPSIQGTTSVQLEGGKGTISVTAKKGVSFYSDTYWTINFFKNKKPVLKDGQAATAKEEVSANEDFELDLAKLFEDSDGAELSYKVSVDGSAAVAAAADYHFSASIGGTYTLVFTANDGLQDSEDTYTVTLKVNNLSTTYDVNVDVPEGVEPTFYITKDKDENGADGLDEKLTATKTDSGYTVAVPENITRISYRADGMGMSFDVSKEKPSAELRKVDFSAKSLAGVEIDAEQVGVAVSYGEYQAVGTGFSYLLVVGATYTYTITPGSAIKGTYSVNTMEGQMVEAGKEILEVPVTLNYSNPKEITTETGAKVQLFAQTTTNYYKRNELEPVWVRDNEDGTTTHVFNVAIKNELDGYTYRVSKEGAITKAGYHTGKASMSIFWNEDDDAPDARNEYDTSTTSGMSADDSILVNVNGQNHLVMEKGSTYRLRAYRIWQIIDTQTNNKIIEPDFNYDLEDEGIISIESVTDVCTGNAKDNWVDITALEEGTTFLEVSYDAIRIVDGGARSFQCAESNFTYNACDPNRTALIVVQVGKAATDVKFGIDCYSSDKVDKVYDETKAVEWDAEFDTVYFQEESAEITLKPTAESGTISEVAISSDKGETWTILAGEEGIYKASVKAGNNIIRVTKEDGATAYQIVRGDKVEVLVDNKTNPGEILKPGDTAAIEIKGVHFVAGKMSGIYNPGYNYGHKVTYTLNGETVQTTARYQYNFPGNAKLEMIIPEDANEKTFELTDGYLNFNVFGDALGNHRNIGDEGASQNTSANSGKYTRNIFPDITISIKTLDEVKADEVIESITNLGEITLESKEALENARAAYDALTDAQKMLVTNYEVLVKAESIYHELEAFDNVEKAKEAAQTAKTESESANAEFENAKEAAERAKQELEAAKSALENATETDDITALTNAVNEKAAKYEEAVVEEAKAEVNASKAEANVAKAEADLAKAEAVVAQIQAEKAQQIANKDKEDAQAAKEAAQAAEEAAKAAKAQAEAEKAAAQEAANTAKVEKEAAAKEKEAAEIAKAAAEAAKKAAENAVAKAEAENKEAREAADKAEKDKKEAEAAKESAKLEKEAAEAAKKEVEAMKDAVAMTGKKVGDLDVKVLSAKKIQINWKEVAGAEKYNLQILCNEKLEKTLETMQLSYAYTKGKEGYAYTIKVVPMLTYGEDEFKGMVSSETVILTPTKPSVIVKKTGSKFKVTAKKQVCTGYQIQVSKKKNFKSGLKKYNVKKATLSKSIKLSTLKKGNNYVRVRAYTKYNEKTVYSKWSKVKTVKK